MNTLEHELEPSINSTDLIDGSETDNLLEYQDDNFDGNNDENKLYKCCLFICAVICVIIAASIVIIILFGIFGLIAIYAHLLFKYASIFYITLGIAGAIVVILISIFTIQLMQKSVKFYYQFYPT